MRKIVLVAVAACGGGGGSNDGTPGVDAAPGGRCTTTPDSCAADTICVSGDCVAAFPRVYSISQVMVRVPTTDPNGAAWDVGGGAPDLLITISVNGTVTTTTTVVAPDQFQATFGGPFDVSLIGGSSLRIDSFDEDVTVNDPAYACVANAISAAMLRTRTMTCTTGGNSMSWTIRPK